MRLLVYFLASLKWVSAKLLLWKLDQNFLLWLLLSQAPAFRGSNRNLASPPLKERNKDELQIMYGLRCRADPLKTYRCHRNGREKVRSLVCTKVSQAVSSPVSLHHRSAILVCKQVFLIKSSRFFPSLCCVYGCRGWKVGYMQH